MGRSSEYDDDVNFTNIHRPTVACDDVHLRPVHEIRSGLRGQHWDGLNCGHAASRSDNLSQHRRIVSGPGTDLDHAIAARDVEMLQVACPEAWHAIVEVTAHIDRHENVMVKPARVGIGRQECVAVRVRDDAPRSGPDEYLAWNRRECLNQMRVMQDGDLLAQVFCIPTTRRCQRVVHGGSPVSIRTMRLRSACADTSKKLFIRCPHSGAHDGVTMERLTIAPKADDTVARAADVAAAIDALSDLELVRLKALARLWSRGLPGGLGWSDILHEAIARVLDGSRPWPPGVPILGFLSGVMRSICNDHWRRVRHEQKLLVSRDELDRRSWPSEEANDVPDPERVLAAAQTLANVYRLFEYDPLALKIIAGMADGLAASEICRVHEMSELDYDTTRRRMRRALLRDQRNWNK